MFQKRVKSKSQRCCPGDVAHARSHTSCNQARSTSGGDTESNLVQIILVCFIFKHHNPKQNAFKLLKGTISVTHWIIFLTRIDVTGLVFRLRTCKKLTCTLQSIFCTRFIIANKYAHLAHVSRVIHLFSIRACSPARFMKTIRHGK